MISFRTPLVLLLALSLGSALMPDRTALAKACQEKEQVGAGLMTADAALGRPVGAVATVAGFALFLVSSPFSALGGNSREAWDTLVATPATYTFKRPLGQFDCPQPPVTGK